MLIQITLTWFAGFEQGVDQLDEPEGLQIPVAVFGLVLLFVGVPVASPSGLRVSWGYGLPTFPSPS